MRPSTLVSRIPSAWLHRSVMASTIFTPHLSFSSAVNLSMRERLDSMSGLPPLYAATMRAPATWSDAFGSFSVLVNAVTCEVSVPTMPRRKSAALASEIQAKRTTTDFITGHCTLRIAAGAFDTAHVRQGRRARARRGPENQGAADRRGPARLRSVPVRRSQQCEDDRSACAGRNGDHH